MMIALPNPGGNFTCTLFLPYEGERSFEKLQTPQEIEAFFTKYFADAIPMMPNYVEDFMSNPTGSLVTIRCSPWVNKKFALIGDAAHATTPQLAAGAGMGIEDGLVLGQELGRPQSLQQALQAFMQRRHERCRMVVNNSLRIGELEVEGASPEAQTDLVNTSLRLLAEPI